MWYRLETWRDDSYESIYKEYKDALKYFNVKESNGKMLIKIDFIVKENNMGQWTKCLSCVNKGCKCQMELCTHDNDECYKYRTIERQVKTIRIAIDLPMDFPDDWDNEMIEFHLNDSSWFWSNLIDKLKKYDEKNGCICHICEGKVKE